MATADSFLKRNISGAIRNPGQSAVFKKSPAVLPATAPRPVAVASGGGGGGGGGAPVSSGGGSFSGGGGGGGFAAPAAAPAPRISLRDFIDQDFGYRQANDEYGDNGRRLREFDEETVRGRGETERDQGVRREQLQQDLGEESLDVANDLAGRGLLRSGGLFLEQDKVNREGAKRGSAIDDLLTSFLEQRGSGRLQQQQANRAALNERINQLTQQYQSSI